LPTSRICKAALNGELSNPAGVVHGLVDNLIEYFSAVKKVSLESVVNANEGVDSILIRFPDLT